MAHLNLRERILEATIAYVGAPSGGRTSNIDRLVTSAWGPRCDLRSGAGDEATCVEVRPPEIAKINGCDVRFRLHVEHDGHPAGGDVDGFVIVVSTAPGASEDDRRAVDALRARLASAGPTGRCPPVVVQVDRGEDDDARPAKDVVRALGIESWPFVEASREEGVIETLETAIRAVLDNLRERKRPPRTAAASPEIKAAANRPDSMKPPIGFVVAPSFAPSSPPRTPDAPAASAPPLIAPEVTPPASPSVEQSALAGGLSSLAKALADTGDALRAFGKRLDDLGEASREIRDRLDAMQAAATLDRDDLGKLRSAMAAIPAASAVTVGEVVRASTSEVTAMFVDIPRATGQVEERIERALSQTIAQHLSAHLGAIDERIGAKVDGIQAVTTATREALTETATGMRRGVESLGGDQRRLEAAVRNVERALLAALAPLPKIGEDVANQAESARSLQKCVGETVSSLEATLVAGPLAKMEASLDGAARRHEVRFGVLDRKVTTIADMHDTSMASISERLEAVEKVLANLLEEAQKPRGWFR